MRVDKAWYQSQLRALVDASLSKIEIDEELDSQIAGLCEYYVRREAEMKVIWVVEAA